MQTIAIPLAGGRFSTHFGGADAFGLYQVDEASHTVVGRRSETPPEHGRGVFPVWLRQLGATVVLAGGMGPRASSILEHHGIEVLLGLEGDDPEALVAAYLDGSLRSTGSLCQEHGFHDCGSHHHEHE